MCIPQLMAAIVWCCSVVVFQLSLHCDYKLLVHKTYPGPVKWLSLPASGLMSQATDQDLTVWILGPKQSQKRRSSGLRACQSQSASLKRVYPAEAGCWHMFQLEAGYTLASKCHFRTLLFESKKLQDKYKAGWSKYKLVLPSLVRSYITTSTTRQKWAQS